MSAERSKSMEWYLRVSASGLCLIFFTLLFALSVRSYWWRDRLRGPWFHSGTVNVWSQTGQLTFQTNLRPSLNWSINVLPIPEGWEPKPIQWIWDATAKGTTMAFPHWFPILFFFLLAAIPWARARYSLRTVFLAVTLVVVVLGIIVISSR
jgi:hypothetical protein